MKDTQERVVVIGSGPCGAMAANILVERGLPVTLLESGEHVPDGLLVRAMGRNVLRRRPSAGKGNGSAWVQELVPGGLSNYWVGAAPRFSPADFWEGARLHEQYRWPLTYEELVPYYARCERSLRLVGDPHPVPNLPNPLVIARRQLPGSWQEVANVASRMGHGLVPMPYADGPNWMMTRTGVGFNSFTDVVRPLTRRPNFELRLGAHALRLEWSGVERRVTSVVYHNRTTGENESQPAAAVIVAAGPLASTRLLFNSTSSDFPDGLGNTEGLLGTHLHEHPQQWFPLELRERGLPRLAQAAYLTRGPIESSSPLLAAGYTIGFVSNEDKLRSLLPERTHRFGVLVFGTMVPTERNRLIPQPSSSDEFGQPQLAIRLQYSDDELQNLVSARLRLTSVMEAAGYPCSVPAHVPEPVPGASVHYGGTVRMHASPRYGMVDGWNRLHAVKNVVVGDASTFTTGVEKNPTLTAMAIAARAADRLATDLTTAA